MPRKTLETMGIRDLTKKMDAIFSRYIRMNAAQPDGSVKCFTCKHVGTVKTMQAGHWIPRQHMATRWEEWNVHPQCYACNCHYGGRPQEYRERLCDIYGPEQVDRYASLRHEVFNWKRDDLREQIMHYRERVADLEARLGFV